MQSGYETTTPSTLPPKLFEHAIVLCTIMSASLFVAHLTRGNSVFFTLALSVPCFFFMFPLCQAFLRGIVLARDRMHGAVAVAPWKTFGEVMWPRLGLWLVLWIVYLAVLEVYAEAVLGGMNWIMSVSSAGLVLGMVAACFVWGPRCNKLWALVLLTVLTLVPTFVLLTFLGALVIEALGYGGYMGLGILFGTPFIVLACLLVAAINCWFWSWLRGGAWFRAR